MLATYSPDQVVLEVAGYRVDSFTSVSVDGQQERFTLVKGIRGKNTRVRNKDSSCTIIVNVMQTSYVGDVFSEIVRMDQIYGRGLIQVTLKDGSGTSLIQSSNAYLAGFPVLEFTGDIQDRQWIIQCMSTDVFRVGGNQKSPFSVFDPITQLLDI